MSTCRAVSQSFKCGPFALADVRKAFGTPNVLAPAVREFKSLYRCFSLTEVAQQLVGLMAKADFARKGFLAAGWSISTSC
jgi:hypothetical protein